VSGYEIDGISVAALNTALDPVLVTVDFGAPVAVYLVDLIDLAVSGAAVAAAIRVEYEAAGSVWTAFGPSFGVGLVTRTRRAGIGPRRSITAQKWRVKLVGLASLSGRSLALGGVRFWREGAELSAVREAALPFSLDQRYRLILTDRNAEIYRNRVRVGSAPLPHFGTQLARVNRAAELDTMLLFHEDVPPTRLQRQGDHHEWDVRDVSFENVPLYQYPNVTYVNGVDEVQDIFFRSYNNLDLFNLTAGGETTSSITYSSTTATTAANIQAALEALNGIGAGNVTVSWTGSAYRVTFVADAGQRDWGEMTGGTLGAATGRVEASTITQGKTGGEAIMSASRGWPGAGTFGQGRLWLSGLKSRPSVLIGSVVNSPFDLNIELNTSEAALLLTPNTEEIIQMRQVFFMRHMLLFSSTSEFYIDGRVIASGESYAIQNTGRRGWQHWLPVIEVDGAVLFVERGGQALREYIYDDAEQSYKANPISVLAPHLMRAPLDLAIVRSSIAAKADLLLMANTGGSATALTTLRSENVTAFSDWSTVGSYVAVGADPHGDMIVVVRRELAGVTENWVEAIDERFLFDAAVRRVLDDSDTISGLGHLEGESVYVSAEGDVFGPFEVEGAAITLPYPVSGNVDVGFRVVPYVKMLPIKADVDGSVMGDIKGISGAVLSLYNTGSITVQANDDVVFDVDLRQYDIDALDTPMMDRLFTGEKQLDGFLGYSTDGAFAISQARPGPFTLRALKLFVEV
jgi:hypothetical protein